MQTLIEVNQYTGYVYNWEHVRTERTIITCSACGHAIVVDYKIMIDYSAGATEYCREDGPRLIIKSGDPLLSSCQQCGERRMQKRTLKAKTSKKHACDERCKNATDDTCSCSCGGVNHGIAHLYKGAGECQA